MESVNTLRQRTAEIEGQITEIGAAPVNLEDFFPKLRAWIDAKGKAYARALMAGGLLRHDSLHGIGDTSFSRCSLAGLDAMVINDRTHLFGGLSNTSRPDVSSTFEALCFFFPDLVLEKLCEEVRTACGSAWGNDQVPAQERRMVIAGLLSERHEIKKRMETIQGEINEVESAINSTAGAQAK